MTQPPPPEPGRVAELLELLDAAAAECRKHGREDLAEKLARQRRQLTSGAWHILVAGEYKKGKSALVNGLLGVPVCGVDPVAFTAVPTLIRHGEPASARLLPDDEQSKPRQIDVRRAASHGLSGISGGDVSGGSVGGVRLRAVEVALPRKLLADGLVLVDTPGLGGGFAAAAAAATMRALALADGVIVVTDASQELTVAEVDFLRHAASVCPNLLCVLTKIDLYPQWQRILELDRQHLDHAGLGSSAGIEVLAVSSTLRELALDTGDHALNAESGFPVLVDRLRGPLLAPRNRSSFSDAATAVRRSLSQVAEVLATEHATLTKPDQRPETLRRVAAVQQRTQHLASPSSRWLNTISDRFADLQSMVDADLAERIRRLDAEATERIRVGDPSREWAQIVPWLYRRTNEELTDAHSRLIGRINDLAAEIAGLFESTAGAVGALASGGEPPRAGENLRLDQLAQRRGGKLEVGMHAARGWSLSSSVVTTLLVTTLHPGLLLILPVTAVLGTVFAVKAVRSYQTVRLDTARNEALRAVAAYLNQARSDAHRACADLIRHGRSRIRDYYLDQAAELVSTARQGQAAAARAAAADEQAAAHRGAAAQAELSRVRSLLATADRMAANS